MAEHLDWPGLAQICRLERTTVRKGKTTVEVQYAISSLSRRAGHAALLLNCWRSHWAIESLHWVRDVTFGEDKCQVKRGNAPQNLAAFRNAVITLLRHGGCQEIAATLRDFSYQSGKLLRFLRILKNCVALNRPLPDPSPPPTAPRFARPPPRRRRERPLACEACRATCHPRARVRLVYQ